jgi:predicted SprT family Zn-dependent metalloprotease
VKKVGVKCHMCEKTIVEIREVEDSHEGEIYDGICLKCKGMPEMKERGCTTTGACNQCGRNCGN